MRSFEFCRKKNDDNSFNDNEKLYENARLPEYQTKYAAGADFYCAAEVTVPSIIKLVIKSLFTSGYSIMLRDAKMRADISPTLIHTGIKANMESDEVLELYNRSSGPKKLGLVLANGVGLVDKDYYENKDNDGEIMFAFYNLKPWDITIEAGDRIGQGVFKKYLRPEKGMQVKSKIREGGFGSTS